MKKLTSAKKKMQMFMLMMLCGPTAVMAQNSAGDYSAGTTALATVTEEIAKYVPIMVKLCYAIAGVVAIVGAISVYIAMNNEEQDVKKKIMMVVGACIFLIAAAQALPMFFATSTGLRVRPAEPLSASSSRTVWPVSCPGWSCWSRSCPRVSRSSCSNSGKGCIPRKSCAACTSMPTRRNYDGRKKTTTCNVWSY